MLKRLQRSFIAIAMFALGSLLIVQIMTINGISIYQRDLRLKEVLQIISANNGVLPHSYEANDREHGFFDSFGRFKITMETPYSTRYFAVEIHKNTVIKISTDNIAAVNDSEAFNYATRVYQQEEGYGTIDNYRYLYSRNGDKALIVFLDFQNEITEISTLFTISIFVGVMTLAFLLVCIYFLSKKALKPIEESIRKQKQFITDASHELKTPLAIISADTEVLEMCEGENEWLTSIKNQTNRMNVLVRKLVDLSKLNETRNISDRSTFNLSLAVLETASDFEARAHINNQSFILSVSPDIKYHGNEAEIRQLVSILCDNAIKYTNTQGTISISLYKSGTNIYLDAFNTVDYVDPTTVSRLFDRFYRADSSRSRDTGGYGIGLSIARAIVERHKGKIKVFTNGTKEITFRITL